MYVPNEFLCPITLDIMKDPVICEDGNSYEKEFILSWLKKSKTSPLTREPMSLERIFPNESLKNTINNWIVENKINISDIEDQYDLCSINSTEDNLLINNSNILSIYSPEHLNYNIVILNQSTQNNMSLISKCYRYIMKNKKIIIFICSISFSVFIVILLFMGLF